MSVYGGEMVSASTQVPKNGKTITIVTIIWHINLILFIFYFFATQEPFKIVILTDTRVLYVWDDEIQKYVR